MTSGKTPQGAGRSSAGASLLIGAGALALGWVALQLIDGWIFQQRAEQDLASARTALPCLPVEPGSDSLTAPVDPGTARIEIPRIELSAMIVPGDDKSSLRRGVGRIAGTAQFDEVGNVGLAAHRDTYFRRLRNIASGDTIRIATARDDLLYIVDWTRVVEPDAIEVLDPTTNRSLTLVTCYPFNYIGPAPKRFVVRARGADQGATVSLPADTAPASVQIR
jgi:sortase A